MKGIKLLTYSELEGITSYKELKRITEERNLLTFQDFMYQWDELAKADNIDESHKIYNELLKENPIASYMILIMMYSLLICDEEQYALSQKLTREMLTVEFQEPEISDDELRKNLEILESKHILNSYEEVYGEETPEPYEEYVKNMPDDNEFETYIPKEEDIRIWKEIKEEWIKEYPDLAMKTIGQGIIPPMIEFDPETQKIIEEVGTEEWAKNDKYDKVGYKLLDTPATRFQEYIFNKYGDSAEKHLIVYSICGEWFDPTIRGINE